LVQRFAGWSRHSGRDINQNGSCGEDQIVHSDDELFHLIVWSATLVGMAASLRAADNTVTVCGVLDALSMLRGQQVIVTGEVVGGFRHGFYLAPDGNPETCPDWPQRGFTRHALIAVRFRHDAGGFSIPVQFLRLRQMHTEHEFPTVVATLYGRIEADWLVITYRASSGKVARADRRLEIP
jgi:hypothetical protein